MWGDIAIAFLLAFIVTFMATPYTIKIAHKVGAVDVPKDQRRMHKKSPRISCSMIPVIRAPRQRTKRTKSRAKKPPDFIQSATLPLSIKTP